MAEYSKIKAAIDKNDGIFRLKPAWVARVFIPPGKRLGLPESQYDLGERGGICERWIGSTTKADNPVTVEDEGLSFMLLPDGAELRLRDAVEAAGDLIMGAAYNKNHKGLGRLAKIFDYADRLPYHIHQMQEHARLVGCNSKEESYYFLEDVDMGISAETYFGVHPYIAEQKKYDILLPHMKEWKDDSILSHARAYKQMPGDGFHVPAGTLHAPGSALTIELQEDSDVLAMLQAKVGKTDISKSLLFKDVREDDREKYGEEYILQLVDWQVNGDPYFYENRHTPPVLIESTRQTGGKEYWVFYNTTKFSGKRVVILPGETFTTRENGAYNILVWRGEGLFGDVEIEGENSEKDELMICYDRAVQATDIRNTGMRELSIFKFFGPDINPDVPMLKKYPA